MFLTLEVCTKFEKLCKRHAVGSGTYITEEESNVDVVIKHLSIIQEYIRISNI
jgi:hypothetical protein